MGCGRRSGSETAGPTAELRDTAETATPFDALRLDPHATPRSGWNDSAPAGALRHFS